MQDAWQRSASLDVLFNMRPPQASIISLDVIIDDVTLQDGYGASCVASERLAIACRFLDYPLLFIHPRSKQQEGRRIKFNTGKSCALSEVSASLEDSLQHVCPSLLLIFVQLMTRIVDDQNTTLWFDLSL